VIYEVDLYTLILQLHVILLHDLPNPATALSATDFERTASCYLSVELKDHAWNHFAF